MEIENDIQPVNPSFKKPLSYSSQLAKRIGRAKRYLVSQTLS